MRIVAKKSCGIEADRSGAVGHDLAGIVIQAVLLLMAACLPMGAVAHEYQAGSIEVDHPYAPPTPPGVARGAGYMTIINQGEQDDRLLGGQVWFAHELEIHETTVEGDVSRMRELTDGLVIPAGGSVTLEPMGKHLMFIDMAEPLVEGTRQKGTLEFEHAGSVAVEFAIEFVEGGMDHDHMQHGDMKHDSQGQTGEKASTEDAAGG